MIGVIACGNLARRDDGAGSAVLSALRSHADLQGREDIKLFDAATDGLAVMFAARGCEELIIIDASLSGQTPGSIFEVPASELESHAEPPRDSHALRWDHALTIGRRLYGSAFPQRITVFLIEAEDIGFGLDLTAPVATAVETLMHTLAQRLTTP